MNTDEATSSNTAESKARLLASFRPKKHTIVNDANEAKIDETD